MSTFTPWYFIQSVNGTDYLTNTGVTVEASTNYHFRISIDSDRKPSIFINGVQYSATTTAPLFMSIFTNFDNDII